jgi:hypothetical protein
MKITTKTTTAIIALAAAAVSLAGPGNSASAGDGIVACPGDTIDATCFAPGAPERSDDGGPRALRTGERSSVAHVSCGRRPLVRYIACPV